VLALVTRKEAFTSGTEYHSVVPPDVTRLLSVTALPLLQIVWEEELSVGVEGTTVAVIVVLAVFVQPLTSVPVTVYVLFVLGVDMTVPPLVADRSVAGVQL